MVKNSNDCRLFEQKKLWWKMNVENGYIFSVNPSKETTQQSISQLITHFLIFNKL